MEEEQKIAKFDARASLISILLIKNLNRPTVACKVESQSRFRWPCLDDDDIPEKRAYNMNSNITAFTVRSHILGVRAVVGHEPERRAE